MSDKFEFHVSEEVEYCSNGCDCCDPTEIRYYSCGELQEAGYGSPFSLEELYVCCLQYINVLGDDYYDHYDSSCYPSENELEKMLEINNCKIVWG